MLGQFFGLSASACVRASCLLLSFCLSGFLSVSALETGMQLVGKEKPAAGKKKVQKKQVRGKHSERSYTYGAYLVPPPPAYMPSILPELQVGHHSPLVAKQKEASPYKRYIYTREGLIESAPVAVRSGVTVWSKANSQTGIASF